VGNRFFLCLLHLIDLIMSTVTFPTFSYDIHTDKHALQSDFLLHLFDISCILVFSINKGIMTTSGNDLWNRKVVCNASLECHRQVVEMSQSKLLNRVDLQISAETKRFSYV
jgi:hypothetical protein